MADDTRSVHTLGIDLSDRKFDYCLLSPAGKVVDRGQHPLTTSGLEEVVDREPTKIVLEVGTHSPWVSRFCESYGHETLVANSRQLPFIYKSLNKNDSNDAEKLARVGRFDPKLLYPIRHRGAPAQADLAQIRSRCELVSVRTGLINHVRGSVKSFGQRLRVCSATSFHKVALEHIPEALVPALKPVCEVITKLTAQIKALDRAIAEQCEVNYPETKSLRQVAGVGQLTALAFVLVLEDHRRFKKSRDVGPFLGLTPKQDDSGETRKQLRITKAGDKLLRRLLVGCAHYVLGPLAPECDLQRWGHELMKRGGPSAKKRAVVAVARRLAVLLHNLWKTSEVYDPFRQSRPAERVA